MRKTLAGSNKAKNKRKCRKNWLKAKDNNKNLANIPMPMLQTLK
jgi:hypothetical protein